MKVLLVPQGEQAVLTYLADDGSTLINTRGRRVSRAYPLNQAD